MMMFGQRRDGCWPRDDEKGRWWSRERDRGRWSRWFRGEGVLADDNTLNLKKGDSTGAKLPLWSLLSLLKPLEEEGKAHGTGDTAVEEESSYAWKKKTELSCCFWQREGLQMALIDAAKGGESSSKDGTVTAIKTATMRSMNLSWCGDRRWRGEGDVADRHSRRAGEMLTIDRRRSREIQWWWLSRGERDERKMIFVLWRVKEKRKDVHRQGRMKIFL